MARSSSKDLPVTNGAGTFNLVVGSIILAGVGMAYLWLGVKENRRARQTAEIQRDISSLELRIKEVESQMNRERTPQLLRPRVHSRSLGLIDIPHDRIVAVPPSVLKPTL